MGLFSKCYNLLNWRNAPATSTPINEVNLNHMDNGINELDNRIILLDSKKAEQSVLNTMVKDVTLDAKTGILTVTLANGSTKTYDLDIEKVVTNFDINDNNELVLTLADGTQKVIDLTRFVYAVDSTATISMSITDRVMRANIVDGSVTMAKLDAAIQMEFRQYMLDAQSARDAALQYQGYSKRYALGDEDAFPGSETDNAKYYYEQTKIDSNNSKQNAQEAFENAEIAKEHATIATQKAASATAAANNTAADVLITTEKAAAAANSERIAKQKAEEAVASEKSAQEKAKEAFDNAILSKRYTKGGVVPEDTEDNAEWYYQNTKSIRDEVEAYSKITVPRFRINFSTGKLVSDKAAKGIKFYIKDGKFYGRLIS